MKRIEIAMLLSLLLLLCACGGPATQEEKSAAKNGQDYTTVLTLPDSVTSESLAMLELPNRVQERWRSEDGSIRLVLETMPSNTDVIHTEDTETVKIGDGEGTLYRYAGETIDYPSLDAGAVKGMYKPEPGDLVLEWETDGVYCRLFGNLSREELTETAASLRVEEN